MNDELFKLLDKADRENRTATIAALIAAKNPQFRPHHCERVARTLTGLATSLKSAAVQDCNYDLSERQEKRRDSMAAKFAKIADLCGFDAKTGGDPRGAVAYLIDRQTPTEGDGWGGGWPVYR